MSLRNRLGVLFLAVLLAAFWSFARRRAAWGPAPSAPLAVVAAPAQPAAPPLGAKRKRRRTIAAKRSDPKAEALAAEAARKQARGSRLRDKGEALGGDGTERQMARDEKAAEKADRDASAQ
jgi:hypothetical protein